MLNFCLLDIGQFGLQIQHTVSQTFHKNFFPTVAVMKWSGAVLTDGRHNTRAQMHHSNIRQAPLPATLSYPPEHGFAMPNMPESSDLSAAD